MKDYQTQSRPMLLRALLNAQKHVITRYVAPAFHGEEQTSILCEARRSGDVYEFGAIRVPASCTDAVFAGFCAGHDLTFIEPNGQADGQADGPQNTPK